MRSAPCHMWATLAALLTLACAVAYGQPDAPRPPANQRRGMSVIGDIPLLTFSDGSAWKSDVGSNYGFLLGPDERMPQDPARRPRVRQSLVWENGNPYLVLHYERLEPPHLIAGLWVSAFGHTDDRSVALPPEVVEHVTGVRFHARAPAGRVHLKLEAKRLDRRLVSQADFVATGEWQSFTMPVWPDQLKEITFVIESRFQPLWGGGADGVLELDDIYLVCGAEGGFQPPQAEAALLDWARDRCLRYFLWNYREPSPGRGIVLERNSFHDLVSVAGLGYAFPAFFAAEREGLLAAGEARARVLNTLRWLDSLDCTEGGGLHGFPYHFLRPDGTRAGESEVSTVDWAICAAGIRVARQRYKSDPEISALATRLLERPRWEAAVSPNGRVSHGFQADGSPILLDWGSSFTEEAYLVALEGVAAGRLEPSVFAKLSHQEKEGFWPSWFGSGFTYNWLQLWTGPREPLATNSRKAYARDARFCVERYGRPVMGLTACETFSGTDSAGFLKWDRYAGETGPDVHLAEPQAIEHRAVCPYGAALALPLVQEEGVAALFEYARLGAVHPLMGFADSVRLEDLPEGARAPIPHWTQFSIDVGPMWMAIESMEPAGGAVAQLYLKDEQVRSALVHLDAALMQ